MICVRSPTSSPPSSSCSTGAKTKKNQKKVEGGVHETCARSAAETKMGYLISLLVAPCFQGTDHALLTDVSLGRTPSIPLAAPKKRGDRGRLRGSRKWKVWLYAGSCRAFTPHSLHRLMSSLQPSAFLHPRAQERMARPAPSQSH